MQKSLGCFDNHLLRKALCIVYPNAATLFKLVPPACFTLECSALSVTGDKNITPYPRLVTCWFPKVAVAEKNPVM